MFDYPVDKRGVVEIVWIYVVAVDLVIEMKSLRIDRAAVASLNSAYAMLIVTPLDRAYAMLIIKIIDDTPPLKQKYRLPSQVCSLASQVCLPMPLY